jgi:hypothetical protein
MHFTLHARCFLCKLDFQSTEIKSGYLTQETLKLKTQNLKLKAQKLSGWQVGKSRTFIFAAIIKKISWEKKHLSCLATKLSFY